MTGPVHQFPSGRIEGAGAPARDDGRGAASSQPVAGISPDLIWALAARINDSDALMRVFAAPEWDELSDDGKLWVVALVRETLRVAGVPL